MPLLEDLYAQNPGVATPTASVVATTPAAPTQNAVAGNATAVGGTAQQATAAPAATATDVGATSVASEGYDAALGTVDANQLASERLNTITSQDSPLMARARTSGMLTSAKRGLQNSSIAAGAAQGAMVDRAMPLAQQEAATYSKQSLTNQAAENRSLEFGAAAGNTAELARAGFAAQAEQQSAAQQTATSQFNVDQQNRIETLNVQLGTDVSKFNAQQLNQAEALNAQMQTAVSQGNAQAYNQAQQQFAELQTQVSLANADQQFRESLAGADMTNKMNQQIMDLDSQINKQYLAGTQAMDLATIQGQYQQLISSNTTAATLFQSYFDGIAQAMANPQIGEQRIADYVNTQKTMLESGLKMIDSINNLDLGDFTLPGATGSPGNLAPTQGTPGTPGAPGTPAPTPTVGAPPPPAPAPTTPLDYSKLNSYELKTIGKYGEVKGRQMLGI